MYQKKFMERAIELAEKGRGKTSPNPLVGAVVVKNNKIISEGYHKKAGEAHAEVMAIKRAGTKASNGELYVTLEPCCFYGKTPPCTDFIFSSGIKKVYYGLNDPNPRVRGRGGDNLKKAGLKVEKGFLEKEIKEQNEIYIKYITKKSPFVVLKTAMSVDGKIATKKGDSKWITSEKAREYVHRLRAEYDAVMVGIGTVLKDDPILSVRKDKKLSKQPKRIIVDSKAILPLSSKILATSDRISTILATTNQAWKGKIESLKKRGVEVISVPENKGRVNLRLLIKELGKRELTSIFLEGGSDLNASMLEAGLVDKFIFFIAPKIIGGREALGPVGGTGIERLSDVLNLKITSVEKIDSDLKVVAYPVGVRPGVRPLST